MLKRLYISPFCSFALPSSPRGDLVSIYAFGGLGGGGGGGGASVPVTINGPLAGFGEVATEIPTPAAQVDFIYNVNDAVLASYTYLAGATIAQAAGEAVVSSGTNAAGYSRLFARRVIRYRPGQGSLIRLTARFSAGIAGNRQLIGAFNVTAGYRFGYVDDVFGILHTSTAGVEIQALTITGAPAAPGNVTITLDGGSSVVVAVTASGSTSICAWQISQADYSQTAGGWDAMALGNIVYFVRRIAGPAGASTFAAGATGTVAAFTIPTTGVAPTESFIPQSAWNVDKFNGTGSSGVTLNPQNGNIYAIQFQYLGYGDAFFYIENPKTGRFALCHVIENANARTATVLRNPAAYITWESQNTGSTTSVALRGASGAAFTEGDVRFLGPRFASVGSRAIGGATLTPILSLRATRVYQSQAATGQLRLDRLSVACDGTKSVEIRLYRNATLTAAQFSQVSASTSMADVDTSATAVSGGTLIYAFTLAKTGNSSEDINDLDIVLEAGSFITVTALSANNSDITATIAWTED
jgi:hypothetical protein